jgi:putative transcriptional regulator
MLLNSAPSRKEFGSRSHFNLALCIKTHKFKVKPSIYAVKGKILIAKPYLGDENFERTVVMVCEYSEDGAFGLVVNQPTQHLLSDFFSDISAEVPVGVGGPVEPNTLHFLHTRGDLIDDAIELVPGLYWSGNFEHIKNYLNMGWLKPEEIRFYLGYSGWGNGQLDIEIAEDVWVVSDADKDLIFTPKDLWRNSLRKLGGNFKIMANSPVDPRLN